MGGLNPGSGAALLKLALPGIGTAWWMGRVDAMADAMARAAEEQTMQEAQVGQSPSGWAAWASWAACAACTGGTAWCPSHWERAAASGACAVGTIAAPWSAGAPCCPAMEMAITSAAKPRKGVKTIIRMTSQRRMGG
jgi:hypothetical protein